MPSLPLPFTDGCPDHAADQPADKIPPSANTGFSVAIAADAATNDR
jgi:hypothetical protein